MLAALQPFLAEEQKTDNVAPKEHDVDRLASDVVRAFASLPPGVSIWSTGSTPDNDIFKHLLLSLQNQEGGMSLLNFAQPPMDMDPETHEDKIAVARFLKNPYSINLFVSHPEIGFDDVHARLVTPLYEAVARNPLTSIPPTLLFSAASSVDEFIRGYPNYMEDTRHRHHLPGKNNETKGFTLWSNSPYLAIQNAFRTNALMFKWSEEGPRYIEKNRHQKGANEAIPLLFIGLFHHDIRFLTHHDPNGTTAVIVPPSRINLTLLRQLQTPRFNIMVVEVKEQVRFDVPKKLNDPLLKYFSPASADKTYVYMIFRENMPLVVRQQKDLSDAVQRELLVRNFTKLVITDLASYQETQKALYGIVYHLKANYSSSSRDVILDFKDGRDETLMRWSTNMSALDPMHLVSDILVTFMLRRADHVLIGHDKVTFPDILYTEMGWNVMPDGYLWEPHSRHVL